MSKCLVCGLENHASIEEYKKIILEIMLQYPNRKWLEVELKTLASDVAKQIKHEELGIK